MPVYSQIFQQEVGLKLLEICEYWEHPLLTALVNLKNSNIGRLYLTQSITNCAVLFLRQICCLFMYASKYLFSKTTMVKHQSETCETLAIARIKILIVILLCMISVIRAEFVNSRKQTQNDWP